MSEKTFIIQRYNGSEYDTLYPETIIDQVDGLQTELDDKQDDLKGLSTFANNKYLHSSSSGELEWTDAGKVDDVTLNGITVVVDKIAALTTVDNVTSAGDLNPLTANQGKLLSDRIDSLNTKGHYLGGWNCGTGLPTSLTSGYTYKAGDWFKIDNAGLYNHSIYINSYYASGLYKANVTVNIKSADSAEMNTRAAIGTWLYNNNYRTENTGYTSISGSASMAYKSFTPKNIYAGNIYGTGLSVTCTDSSGSIDYYWISSDGLSITDTVTTICYAPSGSSYTGEASTTVETNTHIAVNDIYYYDGTNWILGIIHYDEGAEQTSNKVTSISSSSTDTQYPSAKCVYTLIGDVESLLSEI